MFNKLFAKRISPPVGVGDHSGDPFLGRAGHVVIGRQCLETNLPRNFKLFPVYRKPFPPVCLLQKIEQNVTPLSFC